MANSRTSEWPATVSSITTIPEGERPAASWKVARLIDFHNDLINSYWNNSIGLIVPAGGVTVQSGAVTVTSGAVTITSGALNITNGNINYGATAFGIYANTSNGSDSKSILIGGGGSADSERGGCAMLYGNEHATLPGVVTIRAGNVGSAGITLSTGADSAGLSVTPTDVNIYRNVNIASANNLYYGSASFLIYSNTADAADTKSIGICGGGTAANSRGGSVLIYGNEHASTGQVIIEAGDVTGGNVLIKANNATAVSVFKAGGVTVTPLLTASVGLTVTAGPTSLTGLAAGSSTALTVLTGHDSNVGAILRRNSATQTGDLLQFQTSTPSTVTCVDKAGYLAIGHAAPLAKLHIVRNSTDDGTGMFVDRYQGATPAILFRGSQGNALASASASQANDGIMAIYGFGRGATGFSSGSRVGIAGFAAEIMDDAKQGTYLSFYTTDKTTTTMDERMRILDDGTICILASVGVRWDATPGTLAAGSGRRIVSGGVFVDQIYNGTIWE